MSHTMRRYRASRVPSFFVVVLLTIMSCFALLTGPNAGIAFATFVAPPPAPTLPASVIPSATVTGVGEVPFFTDAAVTTSVAVAGTDSVVAGGVGAVGVCGALTLGTCAVAALAIAGAAYATYRVLHMSWGSSHVAPAGAPTTQSADGKCYGYVTGGTGNCTTAVTQQSAPCPPSSSAGSCNFTITWSGGAGGGTAYTAALYSGSTFTGVWTGGLSNTAGNTGFTITSTRSSDFTSLNIRVGIGNNGVVASPFFVGYTAAQNLVQSHTVHIHQECLASSQHAASTLDYDGPSFNDSASSVPDVTLQSCPAGTIPGAGTIGETGINGGTKTLYSMPQPKLDPSNPCSVVGAGCTPTLQKLTDTKTWVADTTDQPSASLPGTFRCEWLSSSGVDGGPLAMSDCVAGTGQPDPGGTDAQPRTGVDDKSCWSGIASWNPIDWVYTPVKCVLKWAFVPPTGTMQEWTTKSTSLKTTFPINIMASGITDLHTVVDVWSACLPNCPGDASLNGGFPVPGTTTHFDPLASAGDTMQNDSKGRGIYSLGQIAIIGGFVFWAWRRIASSFGGKESTS